MAVTEYQMQDFLMSLVEAAGQDEDLLEAHDVDVPDDEPQTIWGAECTSFQAGGVMTTNKGFTVRLPDGDEFQVTIVRSK